MINTSNVFYRPWKNCLYKIFFFATCRSTHVKANSTFIVIRNLTIFVFFQSITGSQHLFIRNLRQRIHFAHARLDSRNIWLIVHLILIICRTRSSFCLLFPPSLLWHHSRLHFLAFVAQMARYFFFEDW